MGPPCFSDLLSWIEGTTFHVELPDFETWKHKAWATLLLNNEPGKIFMFRPVIIVEGWVYQGALVLLVLWDLQWFEGAVVGSCDHKHWARHTW